jgi:DNA-binding PadR family transcriptional regulator
MSGRDRIGDMERLMAHGHGPGAAFGGGRGRRRRGDVRASLLLLLSEQPRNGYQLMQAIEELSRGRWRPSPGSVYPTLAQLEDEGLVRATEQEGSKLFELTDLGREHLDRHAPGEAPWTPDGEHAGADQADLRPLLRNLAIAMAQVERAGDEQQVARAAELLTEARRGLYRILADDVDGVSSERDG